MIRLTRVIILVIAYAGPAVAGSEHKLSPALEQSPRQLIETLRECTYKNRLLGFESPSANYVEAWFGEFEKNKYMRLVQMIRRPEGIRDTADFNDAERKIREVKKLADYKTEQALISMVDAAIRKYGDEEYCIDTVPRLILKMAAQRDRAWAWADAVGRLINRSKERLAIENGEEMRIVESLRQIERSYDWFNAYRD